EYLAARLFMTSNGAPCDVTDPPQELPDDKGRRTFAWRVRCPIAGPLAVHHQVLAEVAPSHRHFVRVVMPHGQVREALLTGTHNAMALATVSTAEPRKRGSRRAAVVVALCGLGIGLTLAGVRREAKSVASVGIFAIGVGAGLLAAMAI
ncbi:hypothetical protein KDL45_19380, partial [bacterium]|nr:hypothetical protein [bacterium]